MVIGAPARLISQLANRATASATDHAEIVTEVSTYTLYSLRDRLPGTMFILVWQGQP